MSQFPEYVQIIDVKPNEITTVVSSLNKGFGIEDLSWASNSSVACFPSTQNLKFNGNHVFHSFKIPEYAEVTITLTPADQTANFSLYGYQISQSNFAMVPELTSCTSCEADYKWDYPKKNQIQDHKRSISFNSTTNNYNIVIGVAGADGLSEGDYVLTIDLKAKTENTSEQKSLSTYLVKAEKGKTLVYEGDLANGTLIHDLSWASSSNVACFPSTQNSKFNGNHLFFITEIPAYSEMTIKLIPDNKESNMSLYAYQVATTNDIMPPALTRCVTCESDHKWDNPKKGKNQDHTRSIYLNSTGNPYRVVIGVAGAENLQSGTFKVEITLQ
ncbi:MAG: hypothetical protein IPM77_12570 [Crocinitomicaceae bacterium]|nr:hypothetical protein [Crocinitomicaceae bacterium]